MPDVIEDKIRQVLDGHSLNDGDQICDFSLIEQNEAIGMYTILNLLMTRV